MDLVAIALPLVRRLPFRFGRWRIHAIIEPHVPHAGLRTTHIHGQQMQLDLSEATQRYIYMGVYDPDETRLVKRFLRPGNVFVDVGAQFGYYSALALGCGARVISLEPTPRAFNKVSRLPLDARQVALGQTPGTITIWITRDSVAAYDPSVYKYCDDMDPLVVPVDTLDNQLRHESKIDLLKLDIEGSEPAALLGSKEVLRRTRAILCEFNARLLEMAGHSSKSLYEQLQGAGFHDGKGVPTGECENRLMRNSAFL